MKAVVKDKVVGGFTVIENKAVSCLKKTQEILPYWIINPDIVTTVLASDTNISEHSFLNENVKIRLKKQGYEKLFPIQTRVISTILEQYDNLKVNNFRPRDLCVSAPTGSGKTLTYVVPIVQLLLNRKQVAVRVIVVLPVKDLAKQVYNVFNNFVEGTGLNIVLLSGEKNFIQEQEDLVDISVDNIKQKADIVVCTPGRLVDHLYNTKGFTMERLRFLVIDEADRVISDAKHDWFTVLEQAVYMQPGLPSTLNEQYNTQRKLSTIQETNINVNDLALNAISSNVKRKRQAQVTSIEYDCNIAHDVTLQKILLSATLTYDPGPLKQFKLFFPRLFLSSVLNKDTKDNYNTSKHTSNKISNLKNGIEITVIENTPEARKIVDNEITGCITTHNELIKTENRKRVLEKDEHGCKNIINSKDNKRSRYDNNTTLFETDSNFTSEIFEAKTSNAFTEGDSAIDLDTRGGVGQFVMPDGLKEYYVSVQPDQRILFLVHLIRQKGVKRLLCFVNTRETACRLAMLLAWFPGIVAKEMSCRLPQAKRQRLLQSFVTGEIQLLICTDLMARGIDFENVDCVVCYEMPASVKVYVHRVGRTARAGRDGLAYTLLSPKQICKFKIQLKMAGKKAKEVSFNKHQFVHYMKEYTVALENLEADIKDKNTVTQHSTLPINRHSANSDANSRRPLKAMSTFALALPETLNENSQIERARRKKDRRRTQTTNNVVYQMPLQDEADEDGTVGNVLESGGLKAKIVEDLLLTDCTVNEKKKKKKKKKKMENEENAIAMS